MKKNWSSTSLPYVLPKSAGQADTWSDDTSGQQTSQHLIEVAEVAPPARIASALSLQQGERAVVRRRLMKRGNRPVELTDSYYPLAIAAGTALADKRKIKGGAPTLLAELGYRPRHVVEEVESREPSASEISSLQLEPGEPVLILCRLTTSQDGNPMEASLMTMRRGAILRYEIEVA
ncbi:GntR family transcriptional regulator [Streptomyces sp. EN16]|uniref:GntR family transcriptional regulator n=1 Tax=Streptomyces sp. EN16 TaxID=212773 RepID=UPI0008517CBE|nr:UTRA domain-containing protein [Streptomyces sp. EN16]